MALHLTIGPGLEALVDPLAAALSSFPADFLSPDVVAIPGEGVRSWLTWRLGERLGGLNGIVANIDWVFPATIGRRALGLVERHDPWGVDTLTWAVHTVLSTGGVPRLPAAWTDLGRARAIADLFDRYGLRRPGMVAAWERGLDVDVLGRPLPEPQRWQPELWRALVQHFGAPSTAVLAQQRLAQVAKDGPDDSIPERVVLAGVTGLPWFQLEVLAALAAFREVHVLAPVPSVALWTRLVGAMQRVRSAEVPLQYSRVDDPTAGLVRHPTLRSWGRASREAQCNVISVLGDGQVLSDAKATASTTLLHQLQAGLRADADEIVPVTRIDDSIRWHRCHGPARQAEVVRDALLHLFERRDPQGLPLFEPRDVAVLCNDIATFAPLLEASFAGAPEQGVPSLPIRVADRTLGGEEPLFDVVTGLVGLLDRRWRRSDVVAFARLPAVRHRFGFSSADLALIDQWLTTTAVRWGLTPEDHHRAGLPTELDANTMRSGLDQLFVGASVASDVARGPGGVAPTGDLEGDDLDVAGAMAEFVSRVGAHVQQLSQPAPVPQWIGWLRAAVSDLARVTEFDVWQWGALDRELAVFSETAQLADPHHDAVAVEPLSLGKLVVSRLGARPSRARFDTGAVTVSTLAGQRGVPRRVIVLVGLDESLLGGAVAAADDLVAETPMVGDPDARAELRAQLLDAVLAASDHLILVSTGFDVHTNDAVPPAVALAELLDVIVALTVAASDPRGWIIDHPRQPWNQRALTPGELGVPGPWTFHRGVAALAHQATRSRHKAGALQGRLPRESTDRTVAALVRGITRPIEALLRDRCDLSLPGTDDDVPTVLPLDLDSLTSWNLRNDLIQALLALSADDLAGVGRNEVIDRHLDVMRRRGVLPPLALGDGLAEELRTSVLQLVDVAMSTGAALSTVAQSVSFDCSIPGAPGRRLSGPVAQVRGDQLLRITPSNFKREHVVAAWVELVALSAAHPERDWHAVVVGRANKKAGARGQRLALKSALHAQEALAVIVDLVDRARCEVIPLDTKRSEALHQKGPDGLHGLWKPDKNDSAWPWIHWAVGDADLDDLLRLPPWPDATGDAWGSGGRLERWAHRLWNAFDDSTTAEVA